MGGSSSGSSPSDGAFLPPALRRALISLLQMPERALLSFDSVSAHVVNAVFWVGACACLYLLVRGLVSPCLRAVFGTRTQDSPLEAVFEDPNLPAGSGGREGGARGDGRGLGRRQGLKGRGAGSSGRSSGGNASSETHLRTSGSDDFPSVYEPATKRMSLIVPAYNEEVRLPTMLDETLHYLEARERRDRDFTFEIIIVDDGSRDNTARIALAYSKMKGTDKVRLLRLHCNHGKGGAVRKGMLRARGELLLMVDADAATRISDVERLEHQLRVANGRGVAIGSRHHLQADAVAQRACHRNLLMHGFNFYVSVLCVPGVKDTQCGFKLFTRTAAQELFPVQHIERWAFDVELLHLCSRIGVPVTEVPVHWVEMPGSKINLFEDIPQMARDILIIRLMYSCRIWKTSIRSKKD